MVRGTIKSGTAPGFDYTQDFTITVNDASSPDPTPPSNDATPTKISTTIGGVKIWAQAQPDGSWLITVPHGTDISKLIINIILPTGAKVSPASGGTHDFSGGKTVGFTVTAEDGYTTKTIKVAVKVSEPEPTEQALINALLSGCEVVYTVNADGTISVQVLLPFVFGFDPATIEAIKALLSGFDLIDSISFAWVDANGNTHPISIKATDTNVTRPYLQISFKAKSLDDLKQGGLSKLEYWLKDNKAYTQTFAQTLAFSGMKTTDATPGKPPVTPEPEPGKSGGGGCNAVGLGIAGLMLMGLATRKYRRA
jgi:hypothetical protein